MRPLYGMTQQSQEGASMQTQGAGGRGQIRATQQQPEFTATYVPGLCLCTLLYQSILCSNPNLYLNPMYVNYSANEKGPYNWLTQSSMDTFADYGAGGGVGGGQSVAMDVSSSLLFTIGRSDSSKRPIGASTSAAGASTSKKPALALPAEEKDVTDGAKGLKADVIISVIYSTRFVFMQIIR